MPGVVGYCYGAGLWIYHRNWRWCTLDYDSSYA